MALFTGTASNYTDLLNRLVTHLTNAGVMGAEVWQLMQTSAVNGKQQRFLKGPGLAGEDEIYVNIQAYGDPGNDWYNWEIQGAVAHNPLLPFETQPGNSPSAHLLLWQSAIPYWLIANGRRFILIAKVSTTYSNAYAGFYLPYATSAEMPYPMYIGGSASSPRRWSTTNYNIGSFFDPTDNSCFLRNFDGYWLPIENYSDSSGSRAERTVANVWPWESDFLIGNNQDLSYGTYPAILHSEYSGGNVYGELQGVVYLSGFANGSENIAVIDGHNHLVVQSMQRTTRRDYAGILLE